MTGYASDFREVYYGVVDIDNCEVHGVMTHSAIDSCYGMGRAWRFTRRIGAIMARGTLTRDVTVVKRDRLKIIRDMARTTITVSLVDLPNILTNGDNTIMARNAIAINTGMIIAAIQRQFQKTGGIMAVIAFHRRRQV